MTFQSTSRGIVAAGAVALSLSLSLLSLVCPDGCAATDTGRQASSEPRNVFRLQATVLELLGKPTKDTVYRYFTEAGVNAYCQKDYSEAQRLFSAALSDAQKRGVNDSRLAVLYTNLAAVAREQHRYGESEKLFKDALVVLHEHTNERCLNYTAKQYAALLRRINRDSEANFIGQNASAAFAFLPAVGLKGRVEKRSIESQDHSQLRATAETATGTTSGPLLRERTGIQQPVLNEQLTGRADNTGDLSGQPLEGSTDSTDIAAAIPSGAGRPSVDVPPPPRSDSGASGPMRQNYKGEEVTDRGRITIRLTYYKVYPRNALDALNMGIRMLRKGADVTLILDKEAVLLANRHFFDEVQIRGKGPMIKIASTLEEFMHAGGKVLASQSWAEEVGLIQDGSLTPGVTQVTDDELSEEYLQRRGSILEY